MAAFQLKFFTTDYYKMNEKIYNLRQSYNIPVYAEFWAPMKNFNSVECRQWRSTFIYHHFVIHLRSIYANSYFFTARFPGLLTLQLRFKLPMLTT